MAKFSASADQDIEATIGQTKSTAFSSYTVDDGDEHESSLVDITGYKHLMLLVKFGTFVGSGPDQVRVTLYTGDSDDQGEVSYWDITDISSTDPPAVLPVDEEVSTTKVKVSIENKDASPAANYADVTVKVFEKS